MSGLFKFVATLIFVALLFWVIVVNRSPVLFSFSPFINDASVPLAVIIFGAVAFGFLWGALIVWINGAVLRHDFRRQKKELKKVEKEQNLSM